MSTMAWILAVAAVLAVARQAATCRDRFLWPFSTSSIWNTPIGSLAVFEPANIFALPHEAGCALRMGPALALRQVCSSWNTSWTPQTCVDAACCYDAVVHEEFERSSRFSSLSPAPSLSSGGTPWCYEPAGGPPNFFQNDADFIVHASPSDPLANWRDQNDWSPGNHCVAYGPIKATLQLPYNWTTPDCGGGNNAMALLLADNRTLLQMQPAFRASPGTDLLAAYHQGCPVPFPWEIDIFSDGALGAHGGSGLSAMGGTLRSGELSPGAGPIRHALKLELFAHDYYFSNGTAAPYTQCYRWPAVGCDGYAHTPTSPLAYNGSQPGLQPGALLAIPPGVAVPTTTAPGALIENALRSYGGYLVDDTATNVAAVCMEMAVSDELSKHYGIHTVWPQSTRPSFNNATSAFYNDLVAIFRALHVVANNAQSAVGGGGVPGAPLAPPICQT